MNRIKKWWNQNDYHYWWRYFIRTKWWKTLLFSIFITWLLVSFSLLIWYSVLKDPKMALTMLGSICAAIITYGVFLVSLRNIIQSDLEKIKFYDKSKINTFLFLKLHFNYCYLDFVLNPATKRSKWCKLTGNLFPNIDFFEKNKKSEESWHNFYERFFNLQTVIKTKNYWAKQIPEIWEVFLKKQSFNFCLLEKKFWFILKESIFNEQKILSNRMWQHYYWITEQKIYETWVNSLQFTILETFESAITSLTPKMLKNTKNFDKKTKLKKINDLLKEITSSILKGCDLFKIELTDTENLAETAKRLSNKHKKISELFKEVFSYRENEYGDGTTYSSPFYW